MFENQELLSEMYFGGNKYLTQIDKLFTECIEKRQTIAKVNPFDSRIGVVTQIYLNKVGKVFKDMFNFKELAILYDGTRIRNAMCLVNTSFKEGRSVKDKQIDVVPGVGFRYKKPIATANFIVYEGLFVGLEPRDSRILTAVLLHEMGHRLYLRSYVQILYNKVALMNAIVQLGLRQRNRDNKITMQTIMDGLNIFLFAGTNFDSVYNKINYLFSKANNQLSAMISFVNGITNSVVEFCNYIKMISLEGLNLPLIKSFKKLNPIDFLETTLTSQLSFKDEAFADNVATMYGYGPEISKFRKEHLYTFSDLKVVNDEIAKNSDVTAKIMNCITDTIHNFGACFLDVFNTRPDATYAMYDQIQLLENTLKDPDCAEQYAEIAKDLEVIKKQYKEEASYLLKEGRLSSALNALVRQKKMGASHLLRSHTKNFDDKGKLRDYKEDFTNIF